MGTMGAAQSENWTGSIAPSAFNLCNSSSIFTCKVKGTGLRLWNCGSAFATWIFAKTPCNNPKPFSKHSGAYWVLSPTNMWLHPVGKWTSNLSVTLEASNGLIVLVHYPPQRSGITTLSVHCAPLLPLWTLPLQLALLCTSWASPSTREDSMWMYRLKCVQMYHYLQSTWTLWCLYPTQEGFHW